MSRSVASTFPDRAALAERLCQRYRGIVDDTVAFREALLRPLPVTFWANRLRLDRETLRSLLAEDGFEARPMDWNSDGLWLPPGSRPGRHWTFVTGLFRIQEEVSMLPVRLLDPRPGERVLDLCAAPGNKTAQIAVTMGNTGTVVANDSRQGRIAALRQAVKRLGLVNVAITVRDGQGLDRRAGSFDRILVDAPCSCEGTFRKVRQPQIVDDVFRERTVAVQLRLLRSAIGRLRPGGRLVYSTCTLAPEENEGVVDTVLREYGGMLCLRPAVVEGFPGRPGITAWRGRDYLPEVAQCLRAWPHHGDTGGFFVAVLEKAPDAPAPEPAEPLPLVEESRDCLAPFLERLGMPEECFAGLLPVRRGKRHTQLVTRDHRFPAAPAPAMLGMPGIRRRSLPPKPTTSAVLLLGRHARCNRLDLNREQAMAYLRRDPVDVDWSQLEDCTGPGYAVARYREQVLGLGQLVYHRDSPRVHLVSLFPTAWSRDAGEAVDEAG